MSKDRTDERHRSQRARLTSLLGGEGAIWRTTVGLLILATLNNLFDILALEAAAQQIVKGAVVVGAVAIDSLARRRA